MDLELIVRAHRKALVEAAERVVRGSLELPDKSQLNRLIAVCGEATCVEEIANYLRYQASRSSALWNPAFADLVISAAEVALRGLAHDTRSLDSLARDRAAVAAWQIYAVFLTRSLTYAKAVKGNGRHGREDR